MQSAPLASVSHVDELEGEVDLLGEGWNEQTESSTKTFFLFGIF
jgi:hypothetical protein